MKAETGSRKEEEKNQAQKQFKSQIAQKVGEVNGDASEREKRQEGAEGKTGDRKRNDVDLRNGLNKGTEK